MVKEDVFQTLRKLQCIEPSQGAKTGKYIENELNKEEKEQYSNHLAKCEKCSKIIFVNDHLERFAESKSASNGS